MVISDIAAPGVLLVGLCNYFHWGEGVALVVPLGGEFGVQRGKAVGYRSLLSSAAGAARLVTSPLPDCCDPLMIRALVADPPAAASRGGNNIRRR